MEKVKIFLMKLFLSLSHFFSHLEDDMKAVIETTVKIVNAVKTWTGTHEDLIIFVKTLLPANLSHLEQQILDVITSLDLSKVLTEDKKRFWHNFALEIGVILAQGKINFGSLVQLIQWFYDNHKTSVPPANLLNTLGA